MDEIKLTLKHTLPFCNISREFPEFSIFRWCNTSIDYLEIVYVQDKYDELITSINAFINEIGSELFYKRKDGGTLSLMISCKCNVHNSTMRIAEANGCMWKAPVSYLGGSEMLTVFSPESSNFLRFYETLRSFAEVNIEKKTQLKSSLMKDTFTISLSDLFGHLTDKQIMHLIEAINAGYFEIPRRVSLEKLASRDGIAESTLQEHLSRSEWKLMEAIYPYLIMYSKGKKSFE
jgi:predicted DNA binding protein